MSVLFVYEFRERGSSFDRSSILKIRDFGGIRYANTSIPSRETENVSMGVAKEGSYGFGKEESPDGLGTSRPSCSRARRAIPYGACPLRGQPDGMLQREKEVRYVRCSTHQEQPLF